MFADEIDELNDRSEPGRMHPLLRAFGIAVVLAAVTVAAIGCTQQTSSATTQPTTPQNIALMSVVEYKNAYDTAIVILDQAAKDGKITASMAADIRRAIPIARAARNAIDAAVANSDQSAANQAVADGQAALNALLSIEAQVK